MKKIFLIITILSIIAVSCTEKVEIKLDETYNRIVVFGNITTDTTTHYVQLTESTSYYYNQDPPAISGAIVTIDDNAGTVIELDEIEPGVYITAADYFAEVGKTYTLDINLMEELGGYTHYTASSTVQPHYPIDSIGLAELVYGDFTIIEVQCWYQDPPSTEFYMFDIFKNGIYLTDTITKRQVTDDVFINGNNTNGIGVGYLNPDYEREKVYPGDTITFRAGFVTEDHAQFMWTLQEEVSFSTPLFSGPPANITGNISSGGIGFFAAFSVAYSSAIATEMEK